MNSALVRLTTRLTYAATQLPRMAWYVGHGIAMRRLSEEAGPGNRGITRARAHTDAPIPDRARLFSDMAALLRRDQPMSRPAFTRCRQIVTGRWGRYSPDRGFFSKICPRCI